ncbi:MAG: SusC/RagA family TonB-linked outer membrane protein [Bacteroidales bacterium]|jgi:TonB-linked SusC/RagA family outer membrane protein|nr:SusC/RagA family TonB-linked outer membrane protein [Bacteroidales bacterium]
MRAIFVGIFVCLSVHVCAQREISGVVTNTDGKPVSYASVVEYGTQNGTYTNDEGTFTLEVSFEADSLEVSFIGYLTQIRDIQNTQFIEIVLQPDAVVLSSVVVTIPYGMQKKEAFTGSLSSVDSGDLQSSAQNSVEQALQGAVPGMTILQSSGQPGAPSDITLRGIGSMNAGSSPLIVIDGIPVFSGDLSQTGSSISVLSSLAPSDIESISVLKDASATSMYGSRASNGVIMITTKKGKMNSQAYSFDMSQGIGTVVYNNFSVLSADEYYDFQAEAMRNNGVSEQNISDALRYDTASTSWFDEVLRPAHIQTYNFSAQGGSAQSKYFASTNFLQQNGIVENTDVSQFSVRLSLDNKATEKITYGISLAPTYTVQHKTEEPGVLSSPVTGVFLAPPTFAIYEGNEYNFKNGFYNPVGSINLNQNTATNIRLLGSTYLSYAISSDISFKTIAHIDNVSVDEFIFRHPKTPDGTLVNGIGELFGAERRTITSSSTLKWVKTYNYIHNIEILGGLEYESAQQKSYNMKASNFPYPDVTSLHAASKMEQINSYREDELMLSYLSRVQYEYNSRYYLSLSYRTDGSSKFSPNHQWGHFWSVGASWILSRESFMLDVSSISFLKMRGSVGTSGNANIGNYAYMTLYGFGMNYMDEPGVSPIQIGNDNLTWEKNRNINLGIDADFFSIFSVSFDAYIRKTFDLLMQVPISMTTGYSHQLQNVGSLSNKGFEFDGTATIINSKNLTWNATLTAAYNKNEILELYTEGTQDTIIQGTKIRTEGEALQSFYLPHWAGVNSADGSPLWYDKNGNITRNYDDAAFILAGTADPTWILGLNQSLEYKQFTLGISLYGSLGNMIFNQLNTDLLADGAIMNKNQSSLALDRWQEPGDQSENPRIVQNNSSHSNEFSTRYIESGSYMRIQDISVQYAVPREKIEKYKLQECHISLQLNNVWVWSQFTGMDPETRSSGVYYYDYPKQRMLNCSLHIGF